MLKLELKIYYDLNGESLEDMKQRLANVVEGAFADGLLTGESRAEIEDWNFKISTHD